MSVGHIRALTSEHEALNSCTAGADVDVWLAKQCMNLTRCMHTLFCSRSQHITFLSSPQLNMYGKLSEIASPVTCSMWPVRVNFSAPDAVSHTFIVRSPEPVTNHSLPGSNAMLRTHPRWPAMVRYTCHGACHLGLGHLLASRFATATDGTYFCFVPSFCVTTALLRLSTCEHTVHYIPQALC